MMNENSHICLSVDIGGSHISACLINLNENSIIRNSYQECPVDSNASALIILEEWSKFIKTSIRQISQKNPKSLVIAAPGPFDYKNGISKMLTINKYRQLFGINIRQYLSSSLDMPAESIHFINDAAAFAIGEYHQECCKNYSKVLALTLGTGFGSTYVYEGIDQATMLYKLPFEGSIADDYFSTRWFIKYYKETYDKSIRNVQELSILASSGDKEALKTFEEFGAKLGTFLSLHVNQNKAEAVVIGGNISKAWDYFYPSLEVNYIWSDEIPLIRADLDARSSFSGAAMSIEGRDEVESSRRKSSQFLIPENVEQTSVGEYDIYPGHRLKENSINTGYEGLAAFIEKHKTVVIDGYTGVFWEDICSNIDHILHQKGLKTLWYNVDAAMHNSEQIEELIAPYLGGDDPVFGRRTTLELIDFFDSDSLEKIDTDEDVDIKILYGSGAELCHWDAPLIYIDLPKNELQFRMRAGKINNLGALQSNDPKQMYKRFYFVDWVVLNKHKQQLLSAIDIIIDDQRAGKPFWCSGDCLRKSLKEMSESFFRVRPWFEPGPWGGTWMKENIGQLSQDVPNYAWSFELIVPENGLLLEESGKALEISFDFLMFQEFENVLGEAADHFGVDFPIRFDYLDTFDGGNLSVQVHPQQDYFVMEFGESFTQDECYYMFDTKNEAKVYLGFKDSIDPEEFRDALEQSFIHSTEVDIEKYVNEVPTHKHDLFLIPSGTIHGSGKDNLVLEISSTPYIFTFKLYDWLRLDLEGKPRPLNIERGFKNLDFSRTEAVVEKDFISKPVVIKSGAGWKIIHLPTHQEHFYDVHRLEFKNTIEAETENQCHIMALVEGTSVMLETESGHRQRFNYAETFVIPAACKRYRIINESDANCKIIKAFVKTEKIEDE